MKKRFVLEILSMLAAVLLLCSCAEAETESKDKTENTEARQDKEPFASDTELGNNEETSVSDTEADKFTDNTNTALVPKIIASKNIVLNPYMGSLDISVHNDNYSTDVISSVAPLGIYPEVAYGGEPDSIYATPNAFFDDEGRAVAAYQGGVAIKELSKDTVKVLGSFIPARDDGIQYSVQIAYSFVDSYGNVVLPTSHGHIIIVRTTDDNGNVLPVFEKLVDIDIVSEAKKSLGDDIDENLLSIVYDYNGNIWFVSGGFRKDPSYSKAGFIGFLAKDYIEAALGGEILPVSEHMSFKRLSQGENAENGISSCPDGVVILTNKSCYLLADHSGVDVKWKVDYDAAPKKPLEGTDVTGIGLAWGGGSTPTLTNDLVLFTDNCMPVKLNAVSMKTGEIVASYPVLDSLTGKEQVSVENSILVYSSSSDRVSVIVCNWFGAGNSNLDSPDADSSIQSYDNIYDANWMKYGNKYISPGVERIDAVKDSSGWHMEKIWTREDIRDTSMLKLSTATGYLYGYWQNMDTNYWGYYILDFDTGETKIEVPVSDDPAYNNMAVGMISDVNGNALYCPTNDKVLLRLQDRFVYLPNHSDIKLDLDQSGRKYINQNDFYSYSETNDIPVSYLNTAVFDAVDNIDVIAFRVNGIDKTVNELKLYAMDKDNRLQSADKDSWQITDEEGNVIEGGEKLYAENLYEIRFHISDQNEFDLCDDTGKIKVSVILCEGK